MTTLRTEVLVIGSGAGGATTAATLAEAGRHVLVVEEGPRIEPGSVEPFSLDEQVRTYRHQGLSPALGAPPIAYAEGRCVGGSTEINSGLWHRLPAELAERWQSSLQIDEFSPAVLDGYAERVERELGVSLLPGDAPPSSILLERGASKLGWQSVEFARAFRYDDQGRGTKQTMSRTYLPRALAAGAELLADCEVTRLVRRDGRVVGATGRRCRPDAGPVAAPASDREPVTIEAEHVFVCGGATQTPTLLQRSGLRRHVGGGLKFHPTIKIAARFPEVLDHDEVPMHRVTEFAPNLTIGGSASSRGHVALALADSSADVRDALAHWEHVAVYYAAIRSEGSGRVQAVPGLRAPVVVYRLTEGDVSRLARGLVHLGQVLLAAGATELYPSVVGAPVVRRPDDLAGWWDAVTRNRANLMTVHLTSTVGMGQDRSRTGADSFGRVWGVANLRVNDASLLPEAPGVNPQSAVMTVGLRNAEHFLAGA